MIFENSQLSNLYFQINAKGKLKKTKSIPKKKFKLKLILIDDQTIIQHMIINLIRFY